jgi:hypothetical protein
MLTLANVIWGARCGKSARRVLLGETGSRGHAYSVRRQRESAYDRKAPHGLPSSRLVSTNHKIGRLLSETHPESGITTYTYDTGTAGVCNVSSAGDLVIKTGPDGVSTCMTYDTIHRLLAVTHNPANANGSPDSHFVYDAATLANGQVMQHTSGRMAEAYTCTGGTCKTTDLGFSYNARGDVVDTWQTTPHSGGWYDLKTVYRDSGILQSVDLGALPTVTYGLNGEGAVNGVTDTKETLIKLSAFYNRSS